MVITCPNCDAKYSIDQSSLKGKGARVTCKSCKTVFPIYREVETEKTPEPSPEEEALPSLEELDVYSLNFKEVGLKSWKVKIKMGLVYDFSDYKTLSKYIRDGKVDKNDKLSSDDGTNWTVISEIEDLEKHFCQVYLQKKKAKQEGGDTEPKKPKPPKEKVPTLGAGLSDLASVLAEAEAEVDGKPSSRTRQKIRPNTQKRPTKRIRSKQKKEISTTSEPEKKGSNTFVLLILLLLVSVGVFLYLNNMQKTAVLEQEQQASQQNVQVAEQDRDALQKQIEEKMDKVRREREIAAEEKRKKRREEAAASKTPQQREAERLLKEQKKEESKPKKKSIEDLTREGEQALRTSRWSDAEKIYTQIVAQRPTAKNQVLLGRALYQQKKYAKAKPILETAARGNVEGYKWLGYIAHEEGDDAGANGFFRTYLKSNPRDAALIQRLMNGE